MTRVCRETSKQRGEEGINEAAGVCSVKQRFRWKAVIMMLRVRAVTWLRHKTLSDEYIYYFAHQLFMQEKVSIKCVLRGFSFPQTFSVFITRFFHHPSDVHRNKPGFWVLLLLQKTLIVARMHTNYHTTGFIQQDQQLINTLIPCHVIWFFSTLYLSVLEKIVQHIKMQYWISFFLMLTIFHCNY